MKQILHLKPTDVLKKKKKGILTSVKVFVSDHSVLQGSTSSHSLSPHFYPQIEEGNHPFCVSKHQVFGGVFCFVFLAWT